MLAPVIIRPFLLPVPKDVGENWDAYRNFYSPGDVQIRWPFMAACGLSVLVGLSFVYFYFHKKQKSDESLKQSKIEAVDADDPNSKKVDEEPSRVKIGLAVVWVAILAHLAFSMQLVLCEYILDGHETLQQRNFVIILTNNPGTLMIKLELLGILELINFFFIIFF